MTRAAISLIATLRERLPIVKIGGISRKLPVLDIGSILVFEGRILGSVDMKSVII